LQALFFFTRLKETTFLHFLIIILFHFNDFCQLASGFLNEKAKAWNRQASEEKGKKAGEGKIQYLATLHHTQGFYFPVFLLFFFLSLSLRPVPLTI